MRCIKSRILSKFKTRIRPFLAVSLIFAWATNVSVAAEPSKDLLAKLRRNFALPIVMSKRIQSEFNGLLQNPSYLNRVFGRTQRYLPPLRAAKT